MHLFYAREPLSFVLDPSIFLAGPTTKDHKVVPSWRDEAVKILGDLEYSSAGCVLIPESRNHEPFKEEHYEAQVGWESIALAVARVIVFWVPRNMETLPGLTTNVEWGQWHRSGKVVLGCPPEAEHVRYLKLQATQRRVPQANTLRETLIRALTLYDKLYP